MTSKDVLYLVMLFILKQRKSDYSSMDLFDLYDLVSDEFNPWLTFNENIRLIRSACLPMSCAKCALDFCKFAEKFGKILNKTLHS